MGLEDRDNGYKATLAALESARRIVVTVGVHEEDGGASEGNGRTVAEVAEANEFGLGVPARPSITAWADEQGPDAFRRIREESEAAIKAKVSPAQRVDALAQVFAGEIQSKIAAGVPPPNAPATIARKGSSTPLIDSGQFRSSIRGRVGS